MPKHRKKSVNTAKDDPGSITSCTHRVASLRQELTDVLLGENQEVSHRLENLAAQLSKNALQLDALVQERARLGSIKYCPTGDTTAIEERLHRLEHKLAEACRGHLDDHALHKARSLLVEHEGISTEERLSNLELVIQVILKSSTALVNAGHTAWVTEIQQNFHEIGSTVQIATGLVAAKIAELHSMENRLRRTVDTATDRLAQEADRLQTMCERATAAQHSCSQHETACGRMRAEVEEYKAECVRSVREIEDSSFTQGRLSGLQNQITDIRKKLLGMTRDDHFTPQHYGASGQSGISHSCLPTYLPSTNILHTDGAPGDLRHSSRDTARPRGRSSSLDWRLYGLAQLESGEDSHSVTRSLHKSAKERCRENRS